jgi:hypothetical protein
MNLFPKHNAPPTLLPLDNLLHTHSHPSLGQCSIHSLSTCPNPLMRVDRSRDRRPPSYALPLILLSVTSASPSRWKWYSALLTPPCNNPRTSWRFMGHTTMASPSVIHSRGTHSTNVMSLALILHVLLSPTLFVRWRGMHLKHKGGGIVRSQPKPWSLILLVEHYQSPRNYVAS